MNKELLSNIRFYFAQSVFNNSCHYKAYNRIEKKKRFNSRLVLWASVITIILLVLQVIGMESNCQFLLNMVSYLGLLVTAYSLVLELSNKEDLTMMMVQHKASAEKYKTLRDEYMSLIQDVITNTLTEEILRKKRNKLQKKYSSIGENAPATAYGDYKAAQLALGLSGNSDEEFTWSKEEINKFLPEELRII